VTQSLRTSRLLLRPWRDEDVAAFAELSANPAAMEYLVPLPGWVARARAHWEEHGFGQWVIEIAGEAGFIGVVGLNTISYEAHFTPAVEVAWRFARAYWVEATPPRPLALRSITVSKSSLWQKSSPRRSPPISVRAG
jgi:RimJ/RimL family protein N-acetyltransferase